MRTAAYTLCKNEIKKIDQWLYYTKNFDFRVILDTGSTDGTYELLKKVPNIILDQFIINDDEYRFDIPRNKNLNMIPHDVDWCLSPDIDEYFSINVLSEMEKTIAQSPLVTNISCTRLDIYSEEVFVGPPKHLSSNKIHKRHDYVWRQPVYEYLSYVGRVGEQEIFNDMIYLVHDQDILKPRKKHYKKLLIREYESNPSNSWNSWFLTNEYFREKDLVNFIEVGLDFVSHSNRTDKKNQEVISALLQISHASNIDSEIKEKIKIRLAKEGFI